MRTKGILGIGAGLILGVVASFAAPPVHFIENKNQWPAEVDFFSPIPGGAMQLTSGSFRFYFLDERRLEEMHESAHHGFSEMAAGFGNCSIEGNFVEMKLLGANTAAVALPFSELPVYYNYFLGSDNTKWASHARAFAGVYYSSVYAGIDLKVYSNGNNLKYDFVVMPGADPSQIVTSYAGGLVYLADGSLRIKTSLAEITEMKPVAYQIVNGNKVFVECAFQLQDETISYSFPKGFDSCYELIIDPLLIFSTYSGSTADNWGSTATPGENGTLYSSGITNHLNAGGTFPATPGSFQTSYGGLYDVSILKYDSTGQQLLYASYLGGSGSESSHSLVVNANHELVVLGTTSSLDFPTTAGAFDRTFNGGTFEYNVLPYDLGSDIYVAKISSDGTQLLASTYLGGAANDGLNPTTSPLAPNYGDQLRGDIITNASGDIFVSTVTSSADFPVVNGFDLTYGGGETDGLIIKLPSTLAGITWASFLGGAASDASHTIKLDANGIIFTGGGTTSPDFPTTAGSFQTLYAGNADGWMASIAGDGSAILAATFTGTPSFNQVYFLDLNQQGEVYIYGQTVGAFPITAGVYNNPLSGQFVQKFDNSLSTLLLSTVFGSGGLIPDISPTAFLVNECNNLYMTGWGGAVNSLTQHWDSNTFGMPVTADAFQSTTSGSDFYFIALTADASQLLYGTYMGGSDSRTHVDGGTSRFDKSGVVYHAVCAGCAAFNKLGHSTSDFPTTPMAWSNKNNSGNCNNAAFKFDLSSLKAHIQTNNMALNQPGYNSVCLPDKVVFQNISTGGQVYYWDFGDGAKSIRMNKDTIVHAYQRPGKYIVKLKAVDQGTCIGKDSTYTAVYVYQPMGAAQDDARICEGTSTQLNAFGGVLYEWKTEDGKVFSTMGTTTVMPASDTTFMVSITDAAGCITPDTVNITVVPEVKVDFDWQKVQDCFSRPALQVTDLTDPEAETFFDFGDGNTSDLDQTLHNYTQDGNYAVRIVGKREFCVFEKRVDLNFFTLKVPNVITPEQSPGKNDKLKIVYGDRLISEAGIHVSLIIYNRWGNKVYESKNYQDDWAGEGLPAGVYYYEASIEEEEVTCKSWVQIVR